MRASLYAELLSAFGMVTMRKLAAAIVLAVLAILLFAPRVERTSIDPVRSLSSAAQSKSDLRRLPVYSDPKASYQLVELAPSPTGTAIVITRRDGPSGISYSRRECACRRAAFRYLGDGASLAVAKSDARPVEPFAALVPGSISSEVCQFACVGIASR